MSDVRSGRQSAVRSAAKLVWLGTIALAIGALVYLTDRDPARAALVPAAAVLSGPALFGAVGGWLPGLTHAFAFSLFTAAIAGRRAATPAYGACALWWAIDSAFEAAQAPPLNAAIAAALASATAPASLTDPLARYLLQGTFDWADLVAIAGGALAAGVVLHRQQARQKEVGT